MNKLNHALTMLTAAGGAVALAPAAHAATLFGTFAVGGYTETFYLQSNGGVADPADGSAYENFALTGDSVGNTMATVGDGTTGFKASIGGGSDSYFGTGLAGSVHFTGQVYDSFAPAFNLSALQPGTYTSDYFVIPSGSVTLTAVPEPEAWALLIAGAGLVGGALRTSRRRAAIDA